MTERTPKTIPTSPTNPNDEGNHMEIVNSPGANIARSQLAWLLLLANNVVERLKVPTGTPHVSGKRELRGGKTKK